MAGAGLTLHPDKTRIVDMTLEKSHFDFLGYRFWHGKGGKLKRLIRPKSIGKLRAALKPKTKRTNGKSMGSIIQDINRNLKGWYGYFKHAAADVLEQVDGWVRGRLRSILRKRIKLKGRGRGRDHRRWPNRYFAGLGLWSLVEAKVKEMFNLREGVKC